MNLGQGIDVRTGGSKPFPFEYASVVPFNIPASNGEIRTSIVKDTREMAKEMGVYAKI
jgi:hypothetical protein